MRISRLVYRFLDLDAQDRFPDLSFPGFFHAQRCRPTHGEVPRELLGERACPRHPLLEDISYGRDDDARDTQAEVTVETGIFRRDDCLAQLWRHVVVSDDDPPLDGKLTDHLTAGSVHPRDCARGVVVEG